jgi:hypothetical protein
MRLIASPLSYGSVPTADPAELLKRITWLHHFTDTRNLPQIKELGGLQGRPDMRRDDARLLIENKGNGALQPVWACE